MSESTIRRALARTATAAVLALTLVSCSDRALPERRIALTECRLPKVPQAVQCGRLEVPEMPWSHTRAAARVLTDWRAAALAG